MANIATIKEQLISTRPSFEEMNLNKLSFSKEMEFAIQIFEKNDYLMKMNAQSIKNCLVNVALSGITLNPVMKFAHLVPRKGQCCLDVSYQGLVKIVTDTGSVKSVKANVVYSKDSFDIELGSAGYVKHKPYLGTDKRGVKVGAYSIAVLNDGSEHIDFMRWDEIMAIKARSEAVKGGNFSPWTSDEDEMAKKTVVKRHWKYLPKSDRALMASHAIDFENETNGIDFEEEKNQATSNTQPAAVKAEYALATEEDRDEFIALIDHPLLKDKIFGAKRVKADFKEAKIKAYDDGTWSKEEFEKIAELLKAEIKYFTDTDEQAETAQEAQPASTEGSKQDF